MHKGLIIGYTWSILLLIGSNGLMAEIKTDTLLLTPTEVEQAIIMADVARKKAASVGGEWRDVRLMIGQARSALWIDDLELAHKLAIKAWEQAELGYAQAVNQTRYKMPSYLKE